ncbi:MAG: PAS domain S-box protein [Methanomassiliicoccales archaeon]
MDSPDYRRLIEHVQDLVYMIDDQGRLAYVNPAVRSLLGYEPEELLGTSLFGLMSEGSAERARNNLRRRLKGEDSPELYPVRLVDRSGEGKDCELYAALVREGDDFLWVQGTIRPIDEASRLSRELKDERSRLNTLVDLAPSLVLGTDDDGTIFLVNRAAEEVLGIERPALEDRPVQEIIPDLPVRFPLTGELRGEHQSRVGESTINWRFSTIIDSLGRTTGLICTGHDITERVRLEGRLREERDLLHALHDLGMVALSTEDLGEMLGEFLHHLSSVLDMPGVLVDLDLHEGKGRVRDSTFQLDLESFDLPPCPFGGADPSTGLLEMREGQIPFLEEMGLGGAGVILLIRDSRGVRGAMLFLSGERGLGEITRSGLESAAALMVSAVEKKSLNERLRHSLDQLNLYHDIIFHDIGNYLMPIRGYLDLARRDLDEGRAADLLDRAASSTCRMGDFIKDIRLLIDLIQGEDTSLERVDFLESVKGAVELSLERFPEGRVEMGEGTEDLAGVKVTADRALPNLFMNLIVNALRHGGGEVTIMALMGEELRVEILDRGAGIPDEEKGRVFDRRYRRNGGKGSGIGLTIARKLVERYGGRIWAEDRVEGDSSQGTRMVVLLPIASEESG